MSIRRHSLARPSAAPLQELREAVGSVGAIPHQLIIDLSVARTDQEYNIAGDVLLIWYAPTITDQITVKINDQSNPAIPFVIGHKIRTPFTKLFITVPGTSTGNMYILYGMGGTEGLLDMEVTAQDIPGAMAGMLTALEAIQNQLEGDAADETYGRFTVGNGATVQLLAANTDRKGYSVQAESTNAGVIYVGFDNTVAANNYAWELSAGQGVVIDDYRGAVHAIASAAGQLCGVGEW